jgi:hypothetical protein
MCRLSLFSYGKPHKPMISKDKIYGAILHLLMKIVFKFACFLINSFRGVADKR